MEQANQDVNNNAAEATKMEDIDTENIVSKTELELLDCPTAEVCVYGDRAEIGRLVSLKELEPGTQEILVKGLPLNVEESSIRISGGSGSATLLEVSNSVFRPESPPVVPVETPEEKKQRERKIAVLQKRRARLQTKVNKLNTETEWLNDFSNRARGTIAEKRIHDGKTKPEMTLKDVADLLDFYDKTSSDFDSRKEKLQLEIEAIDKDLKQINDELEEKKKKVKPEKAKNPYREVTILLHVHKSSEVKLMLHYLIPNASWVPSYDIRVLSAAKEKNVQIVYQGVITNNSGEEWKNAKLSLSTAQASVSGFPPELKTQYVSMKPIYTSHARSSSFAVASNSFMGSAAAPAPMMQTFALAPMPSAPARKASEAPMTVATSEVSESTTNSSFTIKRLANIKSDGKPHKVTIGIIELDGSFSHTCVPQKSKFCYLRARAINTSDFPFLEGKMNVFMDGSFISTSVLKKTSPKDEVNLFLGVDGSVVVEYKEESFSNDNKSLLTAKTKTITYKKITNVKNTKQTPVEITLYLQYPQSTEDKVKVTLLKPNLKEEKGAIVNDFHNLRWTATVASGQTQNMEYSYSVEFPNAQDIEFTN